MSSIVDLLYITGGFSRHTVFYNHDSAIFSMLQTAFLPLIIGIGVGNHDLSSQLQEDSAYRQFTTDYRNCVGIPVCLLLLVIMIYLLYLQEDSAYRQFTTDYRNWCWMSVVF